MLLCRKGAVLVLAEPEARRPIGRETCNAVSAVQAVSAVITDTSSVCRRRSPSAASVVFPLTGAGSSRSVVTMLLRLRRATRAPRRVCCGLTLAGG